MKLRLYASYKESPGLEKSSYSKAILTLGFYAGLAEVLDFYGFKKYDRDKGVSLNEIKEKFHIDINGKIKDKESKGVYDVLSNLNPPEVNCTKGLVLSGRGPVWLYCFLVHYYHATAFVATCDPRLGGAVLDRLLDTEALRQDRLSS